MWQRIPWPAYVMGSCVFFANLWVLFIDNSQEVAWVFPEWCALSLAVSGLVYGVWCICDLIAEYTRKGKAKRLNADEDYAKRFPAGIHHYRVCAEILLVRDVSPGLKSGPLIIHNFPICARSRDDALGGAMKILNHRFPERFCRIVSIEHEESEDQV